jgi:hypothetical protein
MKIPNTLSLVGVLQLQSTTITNVPQGLLQSCQLNGESRREAVACSITVKFGRAIDLSGSTSCSLAQQRSEHPSVGP